MFAGKKSAQIREILISESAWEEMTCLFAPSLTKTQLPESASIQKAKKYAQEAEFWQHVGSKMHFVMVSGDSMKTLVTVFAVK